jgi:hypothetical protein
MSSRAANNGERTANDERRPLLSSPSELEAGAPDFVLPTDGPEAAEKPRSGISIVFYVLASVAGLFFLALFIKGFIDADDVEVRSRWLPIGQSIHAFASSMSGRR